MTTKLTEQINAIAIAKSTEDVRNMPKAVYDALNDAASTIACLNMVKSLSEEEQIQFFLKTLKTL